MRLVPNIVLWDDAYAMKSGSLAFGDSHVEVFPGGPDDPSKGDGGHTKLRSGDRIPFVLEGDSTDRMLRAVDHALPRVDVSLNALDGFVSRARRFIDANAQNQIDALDRRLSTDIAAPIERADRRITDFNEWTKRAQDKVQAFVPDLPQRMDHAAGWLADRTATMKSWETEVQQALADTRKDLDEVDPYLARYNAFLAREGAGARVAADGTPVDRTTFGKLVDDPELGERIADAAQTGADFTYNLDRIKAVIGLRNEFVIRAQSLNAYLTLTLSGRHDRFFLVELERGSIGKLADIEISDTPGGPYSRKTTISGGFRLSAQWGKRIGWFDYRFGLKESTFGIGVDADPFHGRLHFSADLYGENFSTVPRLKLETAVELMRSVYVFGGIDDALAAPGNLRIQPWPVNATTPGDYSSLHYGRDFFAGFTFTLHEEDAARMLRLYGSFIGAFL
jgi:phospholipid/cholesterol/gamma-HCH transport system substrate-binding protein